jgi:flagellar biosynthesis chaperone FliJ
VEDIITLIGTVGTMTAPTDYTVVKPTASAVSSPSAVPTLVAPVWTNLNKLLELVSKPGTPETGLIYDRIMIATSGLLDVGKAFINTATRGSEVGMTYKAYCDMVINSTQAYINEATIYVREIEDEISKFSTEVAAYGHEVDGYSTEQSALIGALNGKVNAEQLGISNAKNRIDSFTTQVNSIINQAVQLEAEVDNYLDIAGRYLASGQAKINEFLIMMGIKTEFNFQKASSEQRA